jgi:hypothetical protein
MTLEDRLNKIETLLMALIGRQDTKEWYSVEEFARLIGRSRVTCRQWCRFGRILASKKASGRGAYCGWAISNEEVLRYQREGLRCRSEEALKLDEISRESKESEREELSCPIY